MRLTSEVARAAILLLAGACSVQAPESTGTSAARSWSSPIVTTATPSPTATASEWRAPSPRAIALPQAARPFDASSLLSEMERSTRPDGVPAAIRTLPVAEAVARQLWTVDGTAWDTFAIGGVCGHDSCTLEVAGTRIGSSGEDLWVFDVIPSIGSVQVVTAQLRAMPASLVADLDDLARTSLPDDELISMMLATARWTPPSEGGLFVLSYRSGGEEGSCQLDVTIDATRGSVASTHATRC